MTQPIRSVPSVLVIEDDDAIARTLFAGLSDEGFEVRSACSGSEGLDAVSLHDPDLVILELGLPDLDGIEVCRLLRNLTENPILAVSRDWSTDRKVRALDQGADDYITTPFSMPELLARIRVALRHRAVLTTVLHHHLVEVGELQIDVDAREVRVGKAPIELTRTEFDLLLLLARNPGKVLDHRTIVEHVWSARAMPSSTALRVHVANLRRKLGTGENRPELATETGVGYRLVAPGPARASLHGGA